MVRITPGSRIHRVIAQVPACLDEETKAVAEGILFDERLADWSPVEPLWSFRIRSMTQTR
jgi:hypothetical protein